MGTIFKIDTDGEGFALLHEFGGGTYDGKFPNGSLIISNSTLYGMTIEGGSMNMGIIFKIDADGSDFILLHDFSGGANDGSQPFGSLLLSGSTIYGMTIGGGDNQAGTIFKIDMNGSGFALLHEFSSYATGRANPEGSLTLLDSTLFGMTKFGGDKDMGVIFKIDANGTGFALLHSFAGGLSDGAYPKGSLLLSGSTLYGMTQPDDAFSNVGTIFKIGITGSGFALLHSFADGTDDGAWPFGSMIISDSTLYGMTPGGGDRGLGVIFSLPLSSITVTSPNGGESWNSGTNHDITWTSTGPMARVRIELSLDNGSSWDLVVAGTANDGRFAWTVPNTPSSRCRIRISDAADAAVRDTSRAVFSIINAPPQAKILSPENGASVYGVVTVKANATDDTGIARVEFYVDGIRKGQAAAAQADSKQPGHSPGTIDNLKMAKQAFLNTIDLDPGVNVFVGNSQYTFTWNTLDASKGAHVLRVVAYDEAGTMGSDSVTVHVLKVSLNLQVERRDIKAFSILRQYAQILCTVETSGLQVARYNIMRRKGTADFSLLGTIAPSELQNNQIHLQDKYLEKDSTYSYRVEACDASGQLIGISMERSI